MDEYIRTTACPAINNLTISDTEIIEQGYRQHLMTLLCIAALKEQSVFRSSSFRLRFFSNHGHRHYLRSDQMLAKFFV